MSAKFFRPGIIALTSFAATSVVIGWRGHGFAWSHGPPLPSQIVVPVAPIRAAPPTRPSLVGPAANGQLQAAPAQAHEVNNLEDPQPLLPDSYALPSYASDQAVRNGHVLSNARTR